MMPPKIMNVSTSMRRLFLKMIVTGLFASSAAGLMATQAAFAEEGGLVYYSVGGNLLNPTPLNTLTQAQGYRAYDSWMWGQGIGMYGVIKRFLVGVEYQSLWGQLSTSGSESLKVDAHYGLLHLGYLAIATPTFQLYPYIGVGPGSVSLNSSKALNSMLSMSQGSNNNLMSATGSSLLIDLGLGANLIVPMSPGNQDSRGPSVALRAGYLLPVTGTNWSSNDLPVTGGPAMNPGGFYTRLMIGFGAYQ